MDKNDRDAIGLVAWLNSSLYELFEQDDLDLPQFEFHTCGNEAVIEFLGQQIWTHSDDGDIEVCKDVIFERLEKMFKILQTFDARKLMDGFDGFKPPPAGD